MILYLDFDGVLHPASVVVAKDSTGKRVPEMQGAGSLFQWAPVLERALADTPEVQIVLSTKWVWWFGIEFVRKALPPALASRVIGSTWEGSENMPVGWVHMPRCEQIRLHARRYGIEGWIAIDDDDQGLDGDDREQFVVCHPEKGLSDPATVAELATRLRRAAILCYPALTDEMRAWEQMAPVGKEIL